MVDLAEHGDAAVLEPVDEPHLPERVAAVERDGDEVADQLVELGHGAGLGHRDVAHVEGEVEVGVLDPHRVVEAEGHLDEPAPEGRREVEALLVQLAEAVEREAAGRGGRVEHEEAGDVHRRRRGLHVQERGVETGESLHGAQ